MTDQEKQKLKEKLAKWVGWHEEKYVIVGGAFAPILLAPNEQLIEGHVGFIPEHTPNFPDSFDDCSEWLVPEVLKRHALVDILTFQEPSGMYYAEVTIWDKDKSSVSGTEVLKHKIVAKYFREGLDLKKTIALALSITVEKLIDGGEV